MRRIAPLRLHRRVPSLMAGTARMPFGKGEQIRRRWAQVIGAARLKRMRTEAGIRCSYVTSRDRERAFFVSSWIRTKKSEKKKERKRAPFLVARIGRNEVARNTLMKELFIKDQRVSHGTLALQGTFLCPRFTFSLRTIEWVTTKSRTCLIAYI